MLSVARSAARSLRLTSSQVRTAHLAAAAATAQGSESHSRFASAALAAGAGALGLAALAGDDWGRTADCCGIVGVVGTSDDASDFLLEGLTILQNRGYDSAGMATTKEGAGKITATKFASVSGTADSINLLRASAPEHKGNSTGIAHTRWATHCGKTDENSHPHLDMHDRIAVVHNGTITNYAEIKKQLMDDGVVFRSQTDTEVIAQLIGHIMAAEKCSCLAATKQAMTCFEGTWGICVVDKEDPGKVVVARNGSPLVVGYGTDGMYIASETSAFSRHTKRFVSLQDGEIAVVTKDGAELNPYDTESDKNSNTLMRFPTSRLEKAPDVKILLSPAPYPHWTIREIMEQPKAIAASLGYGGRVSDDEVYLGGLQENAERMLKIQDLLIAACGTSLNAGIYGAKLMRSLGSFRTVQTIDAGEASRNDIPRPGDP